MNVTWMQSYCWPGAMSEICQPFIKVSLDLEWFIYEVWLEAPLGVQKLENLFGAKCVVGLKNVREESLSICVFIDKKKEQFANKGIRCSGISSKVQKKFEVTHLSFLAQVGMIL